MNKSSKCYSMMTVQRFEQQTDEITVITPFHTVIINQNSDCFNFFLKKLFQFPVLYKIIIVLSTMTYQTVNSITNPWVTDNKCVIHHTSPRKIRTDEQRERERERERERTKERERSRRQKSFFLYFHQSGISFYRQVILLCIGYTVISPSSVIMDRPLSSLSVEHLWYF